MKILVGKIADSLDLICNLLDDVTLTFTKDGLSVNEADRSTVSFVDYFLKASAFEEYGIQDTVSVRIPCQDLDKALSRFSGDDTINLDITESGKRFKVFTVNSPVNKSYTLGCLELPENVDKYNLEKIYSLLTVNISTRFDYLKELLEDIHAVVKGKEEVIPIKIDKSDKLYLKYKNYEGNIIVVEKESKANAILNLMRLDRLMKKRLSDIIELKLGIDSPMLVTFNQTETKKVGEQEIKSEIGHLKVLTVNMVQEAFEEVI